MRGYRHPRPGEPVPDPDSKYRKGYLAGVRAAIAASVRRVPIEAMNAWVEGPLSEWAENTTGRIDQPPRTP